MAFQSSVYVREEGITEDPYDAADHITVTGDGKTFEYVGLSTIDNKTYALFITTNVETATITTIDAFEGKTVQLSGESDIYAIVELKKKNLYAWTAESGAMAYDGTNDITTFYTDTPTPVLNTSTRAFSHLYNNLGKYYYGEASTALMSWTLIKDGSRMCDTYVNSMDNSVIQLAAFTPE